MSNTTISTDLWALARQRLSNENNVALQDLSSSPVQPAELVILVEEQKKTCQDKQWTLKLKDGQKTVVLRDVLTKITTWIQKFIEVGDVAIQYDPQHAALPWAGVRFLLKVAIVDIEKYAAVLEGVERIAKLLVRCSVVERLYRGKGLSLESQLEDALIGAYTSVLLFLLEAYQYFGRSTTKRVFRSIALFLDKFDEQTKAIRSCEAEIDTYRSLLADEYRSAIDERLRNLSSKEQQLYQKLQLVYDELSRPIQRGLVQLQEIKEILDEGKRQQMLEWFSKVPYNLHHRDAYSQVLTGTGAWFLDNQKVLDWEDTSSSSTLWLRGPPGFGKTRLVSILLETLKEKHRSSGAAPPRFFYCARNTREPERGHAVEILRSLVRQMAFQDGSNLALKPAYELYTERKRDGFPCGTMSQDECVDLIKALADVWPITMIIVDALDECERESKRDFLEALYSIRDRSTGLIKVLISSREDADIRCVLEDEPNLAILETDTRADIEQLVKHELDSMIKRRRLLRGTVTISLRQKIEQVILERANGMFRWASQSLQYLSTFRLQDEVEDRLGKLPQDLRKLYDDALDRQKETLEFEEISIFETAFRLLLCLRHTLRSRHLLTAVLIHNNRRNWLAKEDLLDICFNFLIYDKEVDTFRFTHLSIQEYLEEKTGFDRESCHEVAAAFCLKLLRQCPLQSVIRFQNNESMSIDQCGVISKLPSQDGRNSIQIRPDAGASIRTSNKNFSAINFSKEVHISIQPRMARLNCSVSHGNENESRRLSSYFLSKLSSRSSYAQDIDKGHYSQQFQDFIDRACDESISIKPEYIETIPLQFYKIRKFTFGFDTAAEFIIQLEYHSYYLPHSYATRLWPFHLSRCHERRAGGTLREVVMGFLMPKSCPTPFSTWIWQSQAPDSTDYNRVLWKGLKYRELLKDLQRLPLKSFKGLSHWEHDSCVAIASPIFAACILDLADVLNACIESRPLDVNLISTLSGQFELVEAKSSPYKRPAIRPLDLARKWCSHECVRVLERSVAFTGHSLLCSMAIADDMELESNLRHGSLIITESVRKLLDSTTSPHRLRILIDSTISSKIDDLHDVLRSMIRAGNVESAKLAVDTLAMDCSPDFRHYNAMEIGNLAIQIADTVSNGTIEQLASQLHLLAMNDDEWADLIKANPHYYLSSILQQATRRWEPQDVSYVLTQHGFTWHVMANPYTHVRSRWDGTEQSWARQEKESLAEHGRPHVPWPYNRIRTNNSLSEVEDTQARAGRSESHSTVTSSPTSSPTHLLDIQRFHLEAGFAADYARYHPPDPYPPASSEESSENEMGLLSMMDYSAPSPKGDWETHSDEPWSGLNLSLPVTP